MLKLRGLGAVRCNAGLTSSKFGFYPKLAALDITHASVVLFSFAQLFGYEQMNLFKLSLAQLFCITHASVALPSFARIL